MNGGTIEGKHYYFGLRMMEICLVLLTVLLSISLLKFIYLLKNVVMSFSLQCI